jgi:hypothetical protein
MLLSNMLCLKHKIPDRLWGSVSGGTSGLFGDCRKQVQPAALSISDQMDSPLQRHLHPIGRIGLANLALCTDHLFGKTGMGGAGSGTG